MGKESRLLRGLMRTTLDPARAVVQVLVALGFGLWLVVDPDRPAGH